MQHAYKLYACCTETILWKWYIHVAYLCCALVGRTDGNGGDYVVNIISISRCGRDCENGLFRKNDTHIVKSGICAAVKSAQAFLTANWQRSIEICSWYEFHGLWPSSITAHRIRPTSKTDHVECGPYIITKPRHQYDKTNLPQLYIISTFLNHTTWHVYLFYLLSHRT